jgi:hypothetical protein
MAYDPTRIQNAIIDDGLKPILLDLASALAGGGVDVVSQAVSVLSVAVATNSAQMTSANNANSIAAANALSAANAVSIAAANALSAANAGGVKQKAAMNTGDQALNTSVLTQVSGLSVPLTTAGNYNFEANVAYSMSVASGSGPQFKLSASGAGFTFIAATSRVVNGAQTGLQVNFVSANSQTINVLSAPGASGQPVNFKIEGMFITGSGTAPVIAFKAAGPNTLAAMNIKAGSNLMVTKLN